MLNILKIKKKYKIINFFTIKIYGSLDVFVPINVINIIIKIIIIKFILLIKKYLLEINFLLLIKGIINQIKIDKNIIIKPFNLFSLDRKIA